MTIDAEIKSARVGDISIAYREYGKHRKSTPLVLIMGYGCTMDIWPVALLDELSAHYRIIVFDNRGMGLSTGSGKDTTIELMADDTAAFLEEIGISRVHLFGWSMGAFIAQEVALRHPHLVAKLILYAGYCGGREAVKPDPKIWARLTNLSGTVEERITRMFSLLFPSEWLKEYPDRSTYFPPFTEPIKDEAILDQAKAMNRWAGTYGRLSLINQPTLIVAGDEDVVIPPGNAIVMGERISRAAVYKLKGGGHGAMYQFPDRFCTLLTTFLADQSRPGTVEP